MMRFIVTYISTYRPTFPVSATRELKDQIGMALRPEVDMGAVLESELGQKWRYGALKACVG